MSYTFNTKYTDTGEVHFDVRLEATTTLNNCIQSSTHSIILLPPRALFNVSSLITCTPQIIYFNNKSKFVQTYKWYLNDSLFSTSFSPMPLLFSEPGRTYSIKLVADAGSGCSKDSLTQIIKTLPNPLSSIKLSESAICGNMDLIVTASSDSSVATHKWIWTSIDSAAPAPTVNINNNIARFSFPSNNTLFSKQYRLTVIDYSKAGCVDSSTALFTLYPKPLAFFESDIAEACSPWTFKPINRSKLGNNDLSETGSVEWKIWRRGVFQTMESGNSIGLSTTWSPTFILTNTGIIDSLYDVQLIVKNKYGCIDTIKKTFIVHPEPIAELIVGIIQDDAPFKINKQNNLRAIHYPGINSSYLWRIIDPVTKVVLSTSTGITPSNYSITQPGDSVWVELIVRSPFDCVPDTAGVMLKASRMFTADFVRSDSAVCKVGLTITFKDVSISKGTTITEQFWDFGDGTIGSGSQIVHTYTKPGIYWVSLYVKDANGIVSEKIFKRIVVFGAALPDFLFTNACKGLATSFTNNSILGFGSNRFQSTKWDFGDGNFSDLENPTHIYQNAGTYIVTLTIRGDSSCESSSISKTINVYGTPLSNFTYINNCINVPTYFKNSTTPGFGETDHNVVEWDFGDGVKSNEKEPQHIYSAPGLYTIRMITASKNCPTNQDTITKVIRIELPRASLDYPLIRTVRNRSLILDAQSGGVSYVWTPEVGLSNRSVKSPTALYNIQDPSKVNYVITIKDSSGCTVEDRQEVWIFNRADVFVPTAFSPNADGSNDILLPFYINIKTLLYFRLYDRWGKLVFQTSDMNKGWDGMIKGKLAPLETYAWAIECVDADGKNLLKKGMATLIRE